MAAAGVVADSCGAGLPAAAVLRAAPTSRSAPGALGGQLGAGVGAALLGYQLESRAIKTGSRVDLSLIFEALQDRAAAWVKDQEHV